jgi:N6-L-threonylcarbamoyladenine synthase
VSILLTLSEPLTVHVMRLLAIESSCDETAAAVVEDGWKVLSNVIASSVDLHKLTGGVVPEVAARCHVESIIPVIHNALELSFYCSTDSRAHSKSQIPNNKQVPNSIFQIQKRWIDGIDSIAVTKEPGLVTSLLVGNETAKYLGFAWDKPVIDVNHIHGHMYANWLGKDPKADPIEFPVMTLTVSGGHNELVLIRNHGEFEIIGESIDDAAGEAFDKVARILGLGFPGGPAIQAVACKSQISNPKSQIEFPRAWLSENNSPKWDQENFDFSFSGLKSEVLREVQSRTLPCHCESVGQDRDPGLPVEDQFEIAFAFQEAVCDVLSEKLVVAAKRHKVKEVHLAGGVSANLRLREVVQEKLTRDGLDVVFRVPEKISYCTDNAAMIGAAAYWMRG